MVIAAMGTHTGEPFSPDGKLPPVEASGKAVKDSGAEVFVSWKDGKLFKVEVVRTQGKKGSKLEWYAQLGGVIADEA